MTIFIVDFFFKSVHTSLNKSCILSLIPLDIKTRSQRENTSVVYDQKNQLWKHTFIHESDEKIWKKKNCLYNGFHLIYQTAVIQGDALGFSFYIFQILYCFSVNSKTPYTVSVSVFSWQNNSSLGLKLKKGCKQQWIGRGKVGVNDFTTWNSYWRIYLQLQFQVKKQVTSDM